MAKWFTRKWLGAALLLPGVLAGCSGPTAASGIEGITNLPQIAYAETFSQDAEEYFVYFWQSDSEEAATFDPYIMYATMEGVAVFVVDMNDERNATAWYDWGAHHAAYSRVIGEVIDGEYVLFESYSEQDFPGDRGWKIVDHYGDGDVWARLNEPRVNRLPQRPESIGITGTPTLIRIADGRLVGYNTGASSAKSLLVQYGELRGCIDLGTIVDALDSKS